LQTRFGLGGEGGDIGGHRAGGLQRGQIALQLGDGGCDGCGVFSAFRRAGFKVGDAAVQGGQRVHQGREIGEGLAFQRGKAGLQLGKVIGLFGQLAL